MKRYKVYLIIEEDDGRDYKERVDESRVMKECGTLQEVAIFRDTLIDFMQMADTFELVIDNSRPGRTNIEKTIVRDKESGKVLFGFSDPLRALTLKGLMDKAIKVKKDIDGWYVQKTDLTGFIPQKCANCSTMSTKKKSLVNVFGKQYCGPCAWEAVNKKRSESNNRMH